MSPSSDRPDRARLAILAARENIAHIRAWSNGRTLDDLRSDTQLRYAIERAFMAIAASLRDIPTEMVDRYGLPNRAVAGFRNTLAHTYDDILDERVILTIDVDLPEMDARLKEALTSLPSDGSV